MKAALHAVQLDDFAQRYPHQLSGGQQQRDAFARTIVIEPECILFDEPLSALNPLLREEMRVELRELVARLGINAVFVTHGQTEAMSMSDRIAVLSGGKADQYASPEEIYDRPTTEFVAKSVGSSNWVDDKRMARHEKVSLTPYPDVSMTHFGWDNTDTAVILTALRLRRRISRGLLFVKSPE